MNFTGKVVLITGASSGIGAATALKFAKLGASLVLSGRKAENLKEIADKCKKLSGTDHLTVLGSLENEEDTKRILQATIDKYGKLDVLVNNAGVLEMGSIENTSLEQYDRVFNVNVRALYHLTMLAVPYLVKTKGNIVNVSSVTGLRLSKELDPVQLGKPTAVSVLNKDYQNNTAALVEEDTKRILQTTIDKYSKLDVLVNNAGVLEMGSIENTSLEQYDRVFNINVRALYHLSMLAVPYLVKTKGNIVNVSSVNGLRAFPGVLAYCMSKSAVDQFTKCVALELAPKQVRVNSVNPGVIVTELQKRGGLDDAAYANFLERSKETHALGRPGNPEEVADSIVFLASDQASFITATHLSVDGGRHAMCPR